MSNPYVLVSGTQTPGSTTQVLSVATASSAGDVINVAITITSGTHVNTVTDSKGNSYTLLTSDRSRTPVYQYATTGSVTPLTTSDTVTITYSGTGGNRNAAVIGIPGVQATPDKLPASVPGSSGTSASIASGSLNSSSEVVIVIGAMQSSAPAWSAGFTSLSSLGVNLPGLGIAYQVVSSTASVTATATFTSGQFCLLMATYATSIPSSSYLVGKNSAVSGGATTLALPVTGTVAAGDTILVGALATAGSVTGVTDPAGNTYTQIQSETANAGCQTYVFASYDSDALAPGTHGSAGRVGASVPVGNYPSQTTRQTSANQFDSNVGQNWANNAQKIYFSGLPPSALHDGFGADLTSLVAAGVQFTICCQPALNGSDAAALQTALQFWLTAGANIKVVMYQEPMGNLSKPPPTGINLTAAQLIQCYKNYYSMIHGLGIPVVYCPIAYNLSEAVSWYPGKNYVDEIQVDYYCTMYDSQIKSGQGPDPLLPIRQIADQDGKPFGIGEMGYTANASISPTLPQFTAYINYLQSMFTQRLQQGLTNSDVMWWNGPHGAVGLNTLASDGTIGNGAVQAKALLQGFYTALSSTATAVTVTYSTNTSAQAAIAIGDHNVQSSSDKTVGATATTGTTASVATGTLAQAQEHIIAFEANLAAGGSPVLGDALTTAATIQVPSAGPYLTAGYKAVNSTASDTPSATIVSTTWAISVITNPLIVPVITGAPGQGFVGQAYTFAFQETGGVPSITWGTTGGSLPPGLSLSSGGVLSGTPTTPGTYSTTVTATDSLGLQGTLPVSIVIATVVAPTGNVPAQPLPANILSLGDSDAETSTNWTWAPYQNANTPVISNSFAVSGSGCTQWGVATPGDSSIATGLYPVQGSLPHICSAFVLPTATLGCYLSIAWFDSNSALITLDSNVAVQSAAGTWQPLSFATISPANAAFASLVVTAQAATNVNQINVDLAFLAQSPVQVLVDWINPAFSTTGAGGQAFMDVSPWLRHDLGISYTRGRQDAISQVQPGSGAYSLQNDLGTFTRFSTASIPEAIGGSVSLQRRCQVNLADENGQWWTRFDGSISEIAYSFDNLGNTSLANVTLTDVLAGLNRQDPLFCWTKEQVLADSPLYHWTLNDPGNVGGTGVGGQGAYGVGAETSGSNGPPLRLLTTDASNTATIAWQDTGGGVETLANSAFPGNPDGSEFWTPGLNQPNQSNRGLDSGTVGPFTTPLSSVYLKPKLTAQSAQNTFLGGTGYMLTAELPAPLVVNSTQGFSVECWATIDPAVTTHLAGNYGPFVAISLGSSRSYTNLSAGLWLNSGACSWFMGAWSQPPSFRGLNYPGTPAPTATNRVNSATFTGDTNRLPHHIVLTVTYNTPFVSNASLSVDNVVIGGFLLPPGQVFDTISVGAAFGGTGAWYGNLSLVSIYGTALNAAQIAQHCQLGQYGMWETPSDDALAQVANYAGIPPFWSNVSAQHNGLTLMEYSDITGSNALTAMQLIAQAESGLLYVDATGALNFHTRDWRMGYGAPDLLLPPGSFNAAMDYRVIDQFMCNEMSVAGAATSGANGQQGSSLSSTTGAIQQSPNAVASANTQAGYINAASQAQYGVYATNPVSSPLSLPLITWSRAYAQLGIASLTYWPDPNLNALAAWSANSRADPWMFPSQLTVDLLTLSDSGMTINVTDQNGIVSQVPLGISHFYGLEIDNMVTPAGPLPGSLPNETGALEWFIEGITETYKLDPAGPQHSLQLYVSPAGAQRAWIPGDPVYGVLGSTTRVGISQADLSTPQSAGKDVGHDAGPPYWPPSFSTTMNNPSGSGDAFVGDMDMRGIAGNLQDLLTPAMLIVSADQDAQSITNGGLTDPTIMWDAIYLDTEGGMGAVPGYPQWYLVTKPGWYEIDAKVEWATTSGQAGYTAQSWIVVSENAAQVIAAGTGTPVTNGKFVCPVGDAVNMNSAGMNPINCVSTRMYLGLGDMVAVASEHNWTAARSLSSVTGGSMLSLRRVGIGTADDRTEINSSVANGGTVTIPVKGTLQQVTFANTHTYAYHGANAPTGNFLQRSASAFGVDGRCYQGQNGKKAVDGSQTTQIQFKASAIQSALTGHQIQSVTLRGTNLQSYYQTGATLALGTTTVTPGQASFNPGTSASNPNQFHQKFAHGQEITFVIPNSLIKGFVTGSQTALILGNATTTDFNYSGAWAGGPGSWLLTINYV